jgi:hypothetical protein
MNLHLLDTYIDVTRKGAIQGVNQTTAELSLGLCGSEIRTHTI